VHIDQIRSLVVRGMFAVAVLTVLLGMCSTTSLAEGQSGAVYSMTNQSTGNSVIVFHRAPDGTLSLAGSFSTGGNGVGTGVDPLGSQGAVVLDQSNRLLFAVNAGSNDVSVFAVDGDSLHLLDTVSSGGVRPISIAVHERLVYVLNAGTPNIVGFAIDPWTNHLVPLWGSERSLTGGSAANPAEVSFSPSGSILMVTEKGTQTIDTYTVNADGSVSGPISNHSSGATPFGFEFTHHRLAIVSEAGATSNALSSYAAGDDGTLELITGSLQNTQHGVCWALVTGDGHYAYTVNAGSGTLSRYAVSPHGALTLLNPAVATFDTGSTPTDPALSNDSEFLYVRDAGLDLVHGFRIESDGKLTPVGAVAGIPTGGQGLAAR
jgi:6-phosphogluconolactonase (cycloisomerase 2 family)